MKLKSGFQNAFTKPTDVSMRSQEGSYSLVHANCHLGSFVHTPLLWRRPVEGELLLNQQHCSPGNPALKDFNLQRLRRESFECVGLNPRRVCSSWDFACAVSDVKVKSVPSQLHGLPVQGVRLEWVSEFVNGYGKNSLGAPKNTRMWKEHVMD